MSAADVAALCVSLTAGKTKIEIMAAAARNAVAAYTRPACPPWQAGFFVPGINRPLIVRSLKNVRLKPAFQVIATP